MIELIKLSSGCTAVIESYKDANSYRPSIWEIYLYLPTGEDPDKLDERITLDPFWGYRPLHRPGWRCMKQLSSNRKTGVEELLHSIKGAL